MSSFRKCPIDLLINLPGTGKILHSLRDMYFVGREGGRLVGALLVWIILPISIMLHETIETDFMASGCN